MARHSTRPYLAKTDSAGTPMTSHSEQLLAGRRKLFDADPSPDCKRPGSMHASTRHSGPRTDRERPNRPGTYKPEQEKAKDLSHWVVNAEAYKEGKVKRHGRRKAHQS